MTPEEKAHCAWVAFADTEMGKDAPNIQSAFKKVVLAVIAEEREESAKLAETYFANSSFDIAGGAGLLLAREIRKRGTE